METTQRATVRNSGRVVVKSKFLAPTNNRGSRISVTHGQGGKRIVSGWDYALDTPENHTLAIAYYIEAMGWDGEWVTGADDTGYYAVQVGR
jgi:hypothetical protein